MAVTVDVEVLLTELGIRDVVEGSKRLFDRMTLGISDVVVLSNPDDRAGGKIEESREPDLEGAGLNLGLTWSSSSEDDSRSPKEGAKIWIFPDDDLVADNEGRLREFEEQKDPDDEGTPLTFRPFGTCSSSPPDSSSLLPEYWTRDMVGLGLVRYLNDCNC